MLNFFRKYFSLTKSERNGVVVLFIILIIVIVTPLFIDLFYAKKYIDYSEYEKEIDAIKFYSEEDKSTSENKTELFKLINFDPNKVTKAKLEKLGFDKNQINNLIKYRSKGGYFYKKEDLKKIYGINDKFYKNLKDYIIIAGVDKNNKIDSIKYKDFDPNKISSEEWIKLGLNTKLINTIQKYLNAGGAFYKKNDLLKIYGLKPELYYKLEPFIKIDTLIAKSSNNFEHKNSNEYKIVEINTADTTALYQLFNNKQLVKRIIKYRNLLGGFYKKNQLKEVYGFSDSTNFQYIKVDTNQIKKIDINTVDFKSLNKHPYVSYDETKAIFTYRKLMGRFLNINELEKNNLLNKKSFNKIKHYIKDPSNVN